MAASRRVPLNESPRCESLPRCRSSRSTCTADGTPVVTMPPSCFTRSDPRGTEDSVVWSLSWRLVGGGQVVFCAQTGCKESRPRHAAILTTWPADHYTEEQRLLFDQLCTSCPELLCMRALALDFRAALTSHNIQQMCAWIETAKQSGIWIDCSLCIWTPEGSLGRIGCGKDTLEYRSSRGSNQSPQND